MSLFAVFVCCERLVSNQQQVHKRDVTAVHYDECCLLCLNRILPCTRCILLLQSFRVPNQLLYLSFNPPFFFLFFPFFAFLLAFFFSSNSSSLKRGMWVAWRRADFWVPSCNIIAMNENMSAAGTTENPGMRQCYEALCTCSAL